MPTTQFRPTDILTEDLLTLEQAAKEVPRPKGMKPIRYATLWRWAKRGLRGEKLETVKLGHLVFTSRQRLHAFLQATQD
jgi:hypothetical protein